MFVAACLHSVPGACVCVKHSSLQEASDARIEEFLSTVSTHSFKKRAKKCDKTRISRIEIWNIEPPAKPSRFTDCSLLSTLCSAHPGSCSRIFYPYSAFWRFPPLSWEEKFRNTLQNVVKKEKRTLLQRNQESFVTFVRFAFLLVRVAEKCTSEWW